MIVPMVILDFEKDNILFNYEIFGDKLIIGNFVSISLRYLSS